ncbi:MAG: hypothetical protein V4480_01345 [Patescibacteria group bacterium]
MSFRSFVLFAAPFTIIAIPVAAQTTTVVSAGVKSENIRPGGGKVVSENPVLVMTGQVTEKAGPYIRLFSTVGKDTNDAELDIGPGIVKRCFGTLKCRAEVTYWFLPKNDAVDFAVDIGGTQRLGTGKTLDFGFRFEELATFGKLDTQIFRLSGAYAQSVHGVPIRLSAELAYNRRKDWLHLPAALSATLSPSWLPKGMSITPGFEVLIPLNHLDERKAGVLGGLVLTFRR